MKKFYIVLTLAAALFAISCSNQEEYGQFPANEVRFTAAQADVSLSKTVLQSDGAVFWSEGDAINLFYGTDGSAMFTSENQEPAQQATFTGSLG
ncbi:MAG: hypothetical protein IKN31_00070, partial [Bacteroidales bacterium]|nr:hypothetical protein [Bacteroidales bacterium]